MEDIKNKYELPIKMPVNISLTIKIPIMEEITRPTKPNIFLEKPINNSMK